MRQGSWSTRKFDISRKSIMAINGLSSTWAAIVENPESKKDEKMKVKGRKLQTVDFEVFASRAAGINPENEINTWASLVGRSDTLYIAGRRFGAKWLMLQQVTLGDVELDVWGRIIQANIQLSFIEDRSGARARSGKMYGSQVAGLSKEKVKEITASMAAKASKK